LNSGQNAGWFGRRAGRKKSGAYQTPLGKVSKSGTEARAFTGGAGCYGGKSFFNASHFFNKNVFGRPAEKPALLQSPFVFEGNCAGSRARRPR
jgi:hypothetical protein